MADEQNVANMETNDLNVESVKNYIDYGQWRTKIRDVIGRVGTYYHVLRDIVDRNGNTVKGYYFCSICECVLKHIPANGTQPLNRHANACKASKQKRSLENDQNVGGETPAKRQKNDDGEKDLSNDLTTTGLMLGSGSPEASTPCCKYCHVLHNHLS